MKVETVTTAITEEKAVDDCAICLEPVTPECSPVKLDCAHSFHGVCIAQAFRYSPRCPLCRDDGHVRVDQSETSARFQANMQTWREQVRLKRRVMQEPDMARLSWERGAIVLRQRMNRMKLRTQAAVDPPAHTRLQKMIRLKERLKNMRDWYTNRIRAELMKRNVPLHITKPTTTTM